MPMNPGDFTEIARGLYIEGLAVDTEREIVWYSDVIAGGIHGVDYDGAPVTSFNEDRMWTGGVALNADGAVFSSGQYGIMWNDPASGESGWLLDELEGEPINGINEMWPDGEGGLFLGTNDIENIILGKEARPSTLYRLTRSREVIKLAEGIGFANGLAFDGERRRLYVNDTFHCTWSFDVADDLTISNKQRLLEKEDVDGMALDSHGNVWITGFRSNFITRLSPEGSALPRVETPAGSITQVRFAGADLRTYFLNSVPSDGGDTLKEGGAITQRNSVIYRGRSDVPGMAVQPARFDLR
jgi:sugar lactone lactonase YvrE